VSSEKEDEKLQLNPGRGSESRNSRGGGLVFPKKKGVNIRGESGLEVNGETGAKKLKTAPEKEYALRTPKSRRNRL